MDAVRASVSTLGVVGEALRKGDRLFDVDAMLDVIEQVSVGVSNLRSGAGSVAENANKLEDRIKQEVMKLHGEFGEWGTE